MLMIESCMMELAISVGRNSVCLILTDKRVLSLWPPLSEASLVLEAGDALTFFVFSFLGGVKAEFGLRVLNQYY